jgi:hypothetical protein
MASHLLSLIVIVIIVSLCPGARALAEWRSPPESFIGAFDTCSETSGGFARRARIRFWRVWRRVRCCASASGGRSGSATDSSDQRPGRWSPALANTVLADFARKIFSKLFDGGFSRIWRLFLISFDLAPGASTIALWGLSEGPPDRSWGVTVKCT